MPVVTPLPPAIHVWYAPPEAADTLDPAALEAPHRDAWSKLQTARRRRDWQAGRALQSVAHVPAGATFSSSHSGGQAALVVSAARCTLGIDLESLVPRAYADLADLAFSCTESAWLRSLDDANEQCAAFYELWTLKEASIKALRLNLLDGLRQCCFVADDGEWRGRLPVAGPWHATVYAPRPGVRLAWIWIGNPAGSRPADVALHEWPGRTADWPVVRSIGTLDSSAGRAC